MITIPDGWEYSPQNAGQENRRPCLLNVLRKELFHMKMLFASDIHGSAFFCRQLLDIYRKSGAARLVLLGDILYHGPRNDLPREYAPREVISMLNPLKDQIYGKTLYATHGHVFNQDSLPPMQDGDILIHGHTHLLKAEKMETDFGTVAILNPGSVSIPKGGNPNTYAILENGIFTIKTLDGEIVREMKL